MSSFQYTSGTAARLFFNTDTDTLYFDVDNDGQWSDTGDGGSQAIVAVTGTLSGSSIIFVHA